MIKYRMLLIPFAVLAFSLNACLQPNTKTTKAMPSPSNAAWFIDEKGDTIKTVTKTDAEWKSQLDPLAYDVLRHEGTERAFTGKYHDNHKHGIYTCAGWLAQLLCTIG